MAGNYNRDKTKKCPTTSNRLLASCDQFFGLLATSWKWLILVAVTSTGRLFTSLV